MVSVNGSLTDGPDGATVTMSVASEFAPERLWQAMTEPARLADWLGKLDGAFMPGQDYELTFTDGHGHAVRGTTEDATAPHRLALRWTLDDHPATRVVVDLTDRGGEGTDVTLTHSGVPAEHAVSYATAWQTHLEFLSRYLHGRLVLLGAFETRAAELRPSYEAQR